ncbi:MAG TPA: hypothetical protein VGN72_05030 [Tepidisphaeraceae bacterium]|jgi:hypothetical protein|nr:hypothetical protein [Tepidisphaeraceae bacterium]
MNDIRPILALDPSSSRTGYALMRDARTLLEAGLLKPNRADDPANDRIRAMSADLLALIGEKQPRLIVVEDTSGKVARRTREKGANGAGLAVYGKAVGWILGACEATGIETHAVLENVWTRRTHKSTRQHWVIAEFGARYDPVSDSGMDVSDAISLGRWWFVAGFQIARQQL